MNVQPVIRRELQAASRRRETWRLRLYFGGVALGAALFGLLLPNISKPERGMTVLISMAVCGFTMCVLAGAYVTADAVSSEKREGTLGLLFLTPLNGLEIVLGKMFTHALQVKYAVLGGFPLLFLPVLLGGVLWNEVARILLVLLLTLLLSLACGVFWSTVATEARTTVLATAVTMILLTLLPWLWVLIQVNVAGGGPRLVGFPQASPMTALIMAFERNFRAFGPRGPGAASGAFVYWGSVGCSLAGSVLVLGLSGWLLPRVWRRAETGAPRLSQPRLQDVSFGKTLLPSWTAARGAAPLLWLAGRRSGASVWMGLVRWVVVVLFGIALVVSVTTRHWQEGFTFAFCAAYGLHLLTRIELALGATRRLHEEWRSGALEILLTTPIASEELVRAHHHSLRRSFRGRLLLLLALNGSLEAAVILFPKHLHMNRAGIMFTAFFAGGAAVTLADFVTLRWLGLREALRNPTHMKAAARAFARLVAGPWPAFAAAFLLAISAHQEMAPAFVFGLWFAGCLVYDRLMVWSCRNWLRVGLRRRVADGDTGELRSSKRL